MKAINLDVLSYRQRLVRASFEHKGHAGKALLIGGAQGMAGAILLAARACLYAGAGWTVVVVLDDASAQVLADQPELMVRRAASGDCAQVEADVIAIGPGLGTSERAQRLLIEAIQTPAPLVIDADGLNLLALYPELLKQLRKRSQPTVITPHPGEAASLLGISAQEVQADRLSAHAQLHALTAAIVVLKGEGTLVGLTQPMRCREGNPGMGTGGMGDVLTGLIAGLIAQGLGHGLSVLEATELAVQIHAMAADQLVEKGIGPNGLTPSEVILEARSLINIKNI